MMVHSAALGTFAAAVPTELESDQDAWRGRHAKVQRASRGSCFRKTMTVFVPQCRFSPKNRTTERSVVADVGSRGDLYARREADTGPAVAAATTRRRIVGHPFYRRRRHFSLRLLIASQGATVFTKRRAAKSF
jgi:hypothetical protein